LLLHPFVYPFSLGLPPISDSRSKRCSANAFECYNECFVACFVAFLSFSVLVTALPSVGEEGDWNAHPFVCALTSTFSMHPLQLQACTFLYKSPLPQQPTQYYLTPHPRSHVCDRCRSSQKFVTDCVVHNYHIDNHSSLLGTLKCCKKALIERSKDTFVLFSSCKFLILLQDPSLKNAESCEDLRYVWRCCSQGPLLEHL
jgi:hypothetical protein